MISKFQPFIEREHHEEEEKENDRNAVDLKNR